MGVGTAFEQRLSGEEGNTSMSNAIGGHGLRGGCSALVMAPDHIEPLAAGALPEQQGVDTELRKCDEVGYVRIFRIGLLKPAATRAEPWRQRDARCCACPALEICPGLVHAFIDHQ